MVELRNDAFLVTLHDLAAQEVAKQRGEPGKRGIPARSDVQLLEVGFNHKLTRTDTYPALNGQVIFAGGKASEHGDLLARAHVGTKAPGRPGATVYETTYGPKGKPTASNGETQDCDTLQSIGLATLERCVRDAFSEYYVRKANVLARERPGFDFLPPVPRPVHSIAQVNWRQINSCNLDWYLRTTSAGLLHTPGIKESLARVDITDEVRRIVSSEGIAVKEWFPGLRVGYQVLIEAEASPHEGPRSTRRIYKLGDAAYTTDLGVFDRRSSSFIRSFTRRKALLTQFFSQLTSRKACPDITAESDALVWLGSEGTADLIHECGLGHSLCADLILDEYFAPWSLERMGSLVTNPLLSIKSNPALRGADGTWFTGSFENDWEGMPGLEKLLIKKGVLNDLLADRSTAFEANHLLRKLGINYHIRPGDCRTGNFTHSDLTVPSPRASSAEVIYHAHMPRGLGQMRTAFLLELEKQNKEYGYYVPLSIGGGFTTHEGFVQLNMPVAFRVFRDGSEQPVSGFSLMGFSDQLLQNIVMMGNRRRYCPHRCGISDDEPDPLHLDVEVTDTSLVRVGTIAPDAILAHAVLRPFKPDEGYVLV